MAPWWWDYYRFEEFGPGDGGTTETFTGKTDATGTHFLRLDFSQKGEPDENPRPMSVVAQATVMDVNRQAWAVPPPCSFTLRTCTSACAANDISSKKARLSRWISSSPTWMATRSPAVRW